LLSDEAKLKLSRGTNTVNAVFRVTESWSINGVEIIKQWNYCYWTNIQKGCLWGILSESLGTINLIQRGPIVYQTSLINDGSELFAAQQLGS